MNIEILHFILVINYKFVTVHVYFYTVVYRFLYIYIYMYTKIYIKKEMNSMITYIK